MPTLYLDLETRSCADLRKVGTHRYAEDPTTDVILAAWALDAAAPELWYRDQPLPAALRDALADPAVTVSAHHTTFERLLLRCVLGPAYGWPVVPLERWDCTMARARAAGLPGSLEGALAALGTRIQKDATGHALMLRMCKPRSRGPGGRPIWWEDKDRLARLGAYCASDVLGGRLLDRRLPRLSPSEREIWLATEDINDIGVRFDLAFCRLARDVGAEARQRLNAEMRQITGGAVSAASNVAGLKAWLLGQGVTWGGDETEDDDEVDEDDTPDLRRRDVERLLLQPLPDAVHDALQVRLEAGKVSTRKLDTILQRADETGRVQGLLSYHGAATGRYAATGGVQIQNFPRDTWRDWDGARQVLELGSAAVEARCGRTLEVISRMLRGSIVADDGHEILALDYSSVEAVGVAWLAGCEHLVEAFARREKIYEQTGGRVFGLDPAEVGKDSLARFVGKTLVLGAGYGMGWLKFIATCAAQGRLVDTPTAQRGISTYRETYAEIPALWRGMERAALRAVREPGTVVPAAGGRIAFLKDSPWLRMRLPSGRAIRYRDPSIEQDERFGTDKLVYMGTDSKTKRWGKQSTYGGRLCLAGDTQVLTPRGWVRLDQMTRAHRVWDGVDWVQHGGLVHNGRREVVCLDGVWLTPDHDVLTTEGWCHASAADGLHRHPVRCPDLHSPYGREQRPRRSALVDPLRLRRRASECAEECSAEQVMRVFENDAAVGGSYDSWHEPTPRLQSVELHARPLPPVDASSLAQLWRPRHHGLRRVADQLRRVLAGHGSDLSTRAAARPTGQYGRVLPAELPVGFASGEQSEHAQDPVPRNPLGPPAGRRSGAEIGLESKHTSLSAECRLADVYDLCNAGLRQRFTVRGAEEGEPFLAHNCENAVQGLCRDLMTGGMLALREAGYRVVTTVHDEIIAEVRRGDNVRGVEHAASVMCRLPAWAAGFPLRAEGHLAARYSK